MMHCMVDLETMGNDSDAAIVQIGATAFDPGDPVHSYVDTFAENVSLESSLKAGMTVTASTILWWLTQPDNARRSLVDPEPKSLSRVLHEFANWYRANGCSALWSHATFDPVILATAYRLVGKPMPWHYRDARDLRTKFADYPEVVADSYQRHGLWRTRHVAIHDAILQTLVLKDVLAYQRALLSDGSRTWVPGTPPKQIVEDLLASYPEDPYFDNHEK